MQRKIQLILLFFLFSNHSHGNEGLVTISEIENYLNNIETIQSQFIQINDSGVVETGQFLLKKPGKNYRVICLLI